MTGLPDFIVIGAKRAGTSALFAMLRQHPEIHTGEWKEVHFFDHYYEKGPDWYRAQFQDGVDGQMVGEATQTYMFDPKIPARMASVVPNAKLIATLRDPVERAYSEYSYAVARDLEPLSFEEAIESEDERTAEGYEKFLTKSYVRRGLYLEQLERVTEYYPRDKLHVMIFEETAKHPLRAFSEVCSFLGIDSTFVPEGSNRRVNATRQYRSQTLRRLTSGGGLVATSVAKLNRKPAGYAPMGTATRQRLEEYFRGPNEQLSTWLGRNLDIWSS